MAVEWPEPAREGESLPMVLRLENRGVAPPYRPYELRVKLTGGGTNWSGVLARAEKARLPGRPIEVRGELVLPANFPSGEYELALGLFDRTSAGERPVEFALKADLRDQTGYYRVATMKLSQPR